MGRAIAKRSAYCFPVQAHCYRFLTASARSRQYYQYQLRLTDTKQLAQNHSQSWCPSRTSRDTKPTCCPSFLSCTEVFCKTWSHCGPGWPKTPYTDQDGLKLTEILLPLPPECWI